MLSDLELLIRLQQLNDSAAKVRSKIDSYPNRLETLDALVAERKRQLEAGQERLAHERVDRQAFENELAQIQTRLSRFKEQLMEVKTNKEYQAMQTEIAVAEEEVHRLEDVILERMLDGDKLVADIGRLERELIDEQRVVSLEHDAIERERNELEQQLEQSAQTRAKLAAEVPPKAMALFETVSRQRKGIAVAEVRDGHCSSCQVRLRPQLFNDLRSNEHLIQCESCQRILYFGLVKTSTP